MINSDGVDCVASGFEGRYSTFSSLSDKSKTEKIARKFENAELEVLRITDEDLRPFIMNIYRNDIKSLRNLRKLALERCQLDIFAPKELSEKLVELSLEGNRLDGLEVQFNADVEEYELLDVKLEVLNLSSNLFPAFPYKALRTSHRLVYARLLNAQVPGPEQEQDRQLRPCVELQGVREPARAGPLL